MKIVIDLSENRYKNIVSHELPFGCLSNAIKNGTPLKKGKWILQSNGKIIATISKDCIPRFRCSNCSNISFEESNYCSHCGVEMGSD